MLDSVAPYVGAWIETNTQFQPTKIALVAPYVGAWIETFFIINFRGETGRTLRGCVD